MAPEGSRAGGRRSGHTHTLALLVALVVSDIDGVRFGSVEGRETPDERGSFVSRHCGQIYNMHVCCD